MLKTILVTGGAGFIGSCYIIQRINAGDRIINLDKLTYSGNLENLKSIETNSLYTFIQGDIGNEACVRSLLIKFAPDAIVNFAAESHADRSIFDPDIFVRTNVLGTEILLRTVKEWWTNLAETKRSAFRFLHVSTDEVYGSLSLADPAFTEETPYRPNSPYSASKAASDHFARAFNNTYGLPVLITHCSNNYGPRQFPEKLIPLMTLNAIYDKILPIYGSGENIRDWLHVEDHCEALNLVLEHGRVGQTYNIGGISERTNIFIVQEICKILDEIQPRTDGRSYQEQIRNVRDRQGHDFRYATDITKITQELGWKPKHIFEEGLRETVLWYLQNPEWVQHVLSGEYRKWFTVNYQWRA